MDKNKVRNCLNMIYAKLNTLVSMNVINQETFELINIDIDEIEKEIDK